MSSGRTSHVERTAQEPRDKSLHNAMLSRIDQVNERVRLFRLVLQSGPVTFSAGQWLDTYVPGIPKAGGFTITSAPSAAAPTPSSSSSTLSSDEPYLELAVQESPENAPAAWLWRPADEILGSTLQVRVGGSFVFPPAGKASRELGRVVFVAGGVGVNPLMSMMGCMAESGGFDGHVEVLYASKVPKGGAADVVFLGRIARLFAEGRLKGRLQVFATGSTLSDAELRQGLGEDLNRSGLEMLGRRLNHDDLRVAVGDKERASTVVYVCGPQTMTDELVRVLTSGEGLSLEKGQVLLEKWW